MRGGGGANKAGQKVCCNVLPVVSTSDRMLCIISWSRLRRVLLVVEGWELGGGARDGGRLRAGQARLGAFEEHEVELA